MTSIAARRMNWSDAVEASRNIVTASASSRASSARIESWVNEAVATCDMVLRGLGPMLMITDVYGTE
ncbi:hypothetical protein [Bradyrhizobium sp. HKCCYLS20291]|uniref:hypothetical protein n=1 Tax=Bradyrhizobium sp. HKCCYLS20291 TaxID=3420766 RepID=UPI003EBE739E